MTSFVSYHLFEVLKSPNADRYNAAISKNIDSYLGGADFPDFLYISKNQTIHDAAEAAHWPPFQVLETISNATITNLQV